MQRALAPPVLLLFDRDVESIKAIVLNIKLERNWPCRSRLILSEKEKSRVPTLCQHVEALEPNAIISVL